ncbi:NACHT domain-containing protein (plasmid) [Bacillus sp. N5-665]|uniref:NACHT domain-containing protein n=1 Tax=Bacillus sp. N5-665 TaxID=2925318 RepID=UPI001F53E117|nr:NACHT domain-containing protein [Bacillus sp. N5-665]UNK30994.1 NACHT domain-containing protein [Bacillus sp. N5-665]
MLNKIATNPFAVVAATEVIKQSVTGVMNTWVKPKMEAIKERRKIDKKLESYFFDVFHDYLVRTYEQNKFVNVIALGNNQVDIDKIYYPLRISSENGEESYPITNYNSILFNKYKKVIIEDSAGMGKSTIMKKLFISCIEKNEGIPIFIELRKLQEETEIVDLVLNQLNSIHLEHDKQVILEIINRGDFIFFLDGFDEIPFDYKDKVTHNLKEFIAKSNNNIFILTSRSDDVLSSFGQFKKFHINGMETNEAYGLIERYDRFLKLNLSESIIKQINKNIEQEAFNDLEEFLKVPFLVSLIYLTYKHKRDVPLQKDQFYRKVYDALFEEHDLSKDGYKRQRYSGLSIDQLHKLLRKLGYLCLIENRVEYTKDKLLSLIEESVDSPYFENIKPHDVFKDLIYNVPLIIEEGLTYRWAHKSFMEYFAAQFIFIDNGDKKEKILGNVMKSKRVSIYLNMLDLYYDIDQETFDKAIIYPILKNYIEYIGDQAQYRFKGELLYKEFMYGKIFTFKNNVEEKEIETFGHETPSPLRDTQRILGEYYSTNPETFYPITYVRNLRLNRELGIFSEKSNVVHLFTLLKNKNSKILNSLEVRKGEHIAKINKDMHIVSYLDGGLSEAEIKANMESILNSRFIGNREIRHYFNYKECIKYVKRIEIQIEKRNNDIIFTDL